MKPFLSSVVVFTLSAAATSVLAHNTVGARIQAGKSAADGVYTEAQSARGQALYDKMCASCHGDRLDGTAMAKVSKYPAGATELAPGPGLAEISLKAK